MTPSDTVYDPNKLQITHEAAWRRMHCLPPMGWLCDYRAYKMVPDPELFPKLRKVWELILSGVSIEHARKIANDELGVRTPRHGTLGGKPLVRCAMYKMLSDPFYAGYVRLHGKLVPGLHEPMVTKEEFRKVRELLTKRRRSWQGYLNGGSLPDRGTEANAKQMEASVESQMPSSIHS